jgi:hypothetical protein
MELSPASGMTSVECGQPFRPPSGGVLAVDGRFPARAAAAEDLLSGTVEVTGQAGLKGVAQPGADVFLVQEGRVVAMPLPQDAVGMLWATAPGETKSLPGEVALTSCDSGEPLAAGTYEVYARVMIIPDDGGGAESFGGPWPLEVQ